MLRLVGDLRRALESHVPAGEAIFVAITAPIRRPAATAAAIEDLVRSGLPAADIARRGASGGEVAVRIHGNEVRIRRVARSSPDRPAVLGFVHDPGADAGRILAVAAAWLGGERTGVGSDGG